MRRVTSSLVPCGRTFGATSKLIAPFGKLQGDMKAEMQEMRSEIQTLRETIKDETHSRWKKSERILCLSGVAGLFSFLFVVKCHYDHAQMITLLEERASARALDRSERFIEGNVKGSIF